MSASGGNNQHRRTTNLIQRPTGTSNNQQTYPQNAPYGAVQNQGYWAPPFGGYPIGFNFQYQGIPSFGYNPMMAYATPMHNGSNLRTTAEGYTFSQTYDPKQDIQAPPETFPGNSFDHNKVTHGFRRGSPQKGGGSRLSQNSAVCSKAGCGFKGTAKYVREHEEDRHLIFAPGREPKPWDSKQITVTPKIEGTTITLDTPEAIAKWIAERKKRWPTTKVVQEKEKLREERIAAGLEPAPKPRGQGSIRGKKRQLQTANRSTKRAKTDASSDSSSSESSSSSGSDTESSDSEDEAPETMSTRNVAKEEEKVAEPKPKIQSVCKYWRQKKCSLGDSCRYLHSLPPKSTQPRDSVKKGIPAPPRNPFARPDSFSQLAERDVAHFVSDVLYALDFFATNDWLKGVETRIGQIDEEGGITVLTPENI